MSDSSKPWINIQMKRFVIVTLMDDTSINAMLSPLLSKEVVSPGDFYAFI